jgi:two-component system, chemotaxis family, response regulator Rcp1
MTDTLPARNVLLVEDNPADAELVREWIQERKLNLNLTWLADGVSAIKYLIDSPTPSQFPKLILLDINLPRMSGIEVLREIKTDDKLKKIPVVMLTSSSNHDDVNASYMTHANAYVQKHLNLESFYRSLGCIHCMFLETSIPPSFNAAPF